MADPFLNIPPFAPFEDRAVTNASAHIGWAIAIVLNGYVFLGGATGAIGATLAWVIWAITTEFPTHLDAAPSETRTDIVTRCVPALVMMVLLLLVK